MQDDSALLQRYARTRDQAAFAELTRRYVNLVYSAATRRLGDRHLAEDVTQAVFMILAKKPRAARRTSPLSAWLLTTVRYAAANALKIERRRRAHEARAAADSAASGGCSPNPSDVLVWQELAEHIDDAVLKLPALDRQAVLLRYFEDRPIAQIAATMQTTEGAAKQRLNRSLDKLRKRLSRFGPALPANATAGLSALLAAHLVRAAPAKLISSVTTAGVAASASAASITISKGAITMMTLAKLKTIAAILLVATLAGSGLFIATQRGAEAQNQPGASARATPAQLSQLATARVQAAQDVVRTLNARAQAAEPLTPTFVELMALAQRRLADAQIDATDDPAARAKIAQQHLQQCQNSLILLKARMQAGGDVSNVQVAQGAYHLADAEYMLAKIQSGR